MGINTKSYPNSLPMWLQSTFLILLSSIFISYALALEESSQIKSPGAFYTAVATKVISPYSTYNISVSVEHRRNNGTDKKEDAATPLQFKAELQSIKENYTSQETVSILPGSTGVISFQIHELTAQEYNLTLKVKDGEDRKEIEDTIVIYPKTNDETIILIHTDKPTYKPGETVQYRIVLLDAEAKPFLPSVEKNYELQVKISDPEGNLIKVWNHAQTNTGLFSAKLELSSEPVLGDWKIEVNPKLLVLVPPPPTNGSNEVSRVASSTPNWVSTPIDRQTTTRGFAVDQYVLPKFKVDVKLPPFITFNQTKVPVQVKATYTYGKGVKGECLIVPKRSFSGENEKFVTSTFPIDGSTVNEIDIEHLFKDRGNKYEQEIEFEVQVTESVTGKSQNGTGKVYMHRYPYRIEATGTSEYIKPGLPFNIYFKISTHDDIPIHDPSPNAVKITHGFSYESPQNTIETSIPPNGLVFLKFATPTNEFNHATRIDVTYKDLTYTYNVPQKYNADTASYMNINWLGENKVAWDISQPTLLTNSKIVVNVNSSKPFSSLTYLVRGGRQEILDFKQINLDSPVSEYKLEVTCPPKAPPEARIIVFVINDKSEVIAHWIQFTARTPEKDLGNYLNVTISDSELNKTFEPGQNISLKLDSRPNSVIALRGVDQSVLLLKQQDVDITQEAVDKDIQSKNNEAMRGFHSWGGSKAFEVFDNAGLIVFTNADMPKGSVSRSYYFHHSFQAEFAPASLSSRVQTTSAPFARGPSGPSGKSEGASIRVRSKFPETWLWEEVALNGSNSFNLQKTVPDTLTSWIITGYSLNTDYGLGVLSQPQKMTIFRPFFISLNLPYSVVKGEVLVLQVLVHNYLPSEGNPNTTAEITLDNSKGQFQFNDKSLKDAKSHKKTVVCPPNEVTSVNFVIVPTEFGSIMLEVRGIIQNHMTMAGDALSQPLKVIPPGQQQRRTRSVLISTGTAANINNNSMEASLTAIFPKSRVEGADKVKMSFISDILGSTIANLDQMIQMPTGCGEQNMLNFVADIVILNYLKHTYNLDEKVKTKAIKFLESGYQRELTYRHWDGSFSAFGSSDTAGSTWLTAFVVRSFIQAQPHITIDDNVIEKALGFLSNNQEFSGGGLFEAGKVFSSQLQGGSGTSGVALTAYTILAFIEASQYKERIEKQRQEEAAKGGSTPHSDDQNKNEEKPYSGNIQRGLDFITNKTKDIGKEDIYAVVLTTYALHLANHTLKDEYFDKLKELATHKGGLTFWEDKKNKTRLSNETENRPWEIVTKPVSVEMTGYALLTYILRGKVADSFPLVKWLLKERNSNGGFHSTQDTVLGLTSLAKYAELTKENITNLQVNASYGTGSKDITIDKNNADTLQEFELPQNTSSVQLTTSGTGTVLAQLTSTYYVEDGVPEPAFAVDVKTSSKSDDELELKICTSYLRGDASNMAIIEVNLPSGYSVDTVETLVNLKGVPGYKRYDTENRDTKLEIYMDTITSNRTCVPVTALRSFKVGKQAPAAVNVYDYYDTTKSARVFYEAPVLSICDICKENDDCPNSSCK